MISRLVPNGLGLEGECGWRARWSCGSQMTHELEEVANSAGHLSQEFKEFWRCFLTHHWRTQRRTDGLWSDKPSRREVIRKFRKTLKLWGFPFLLCTSLTFGLLPCTSHFFPSLFRYAPILNKLCKFWLTSIKRSDAPFSIPILCAEDSFRPPMIIMKIPVEACSFPVSSPNAVYKDQ